jgi:prenyltransferase beta subunit
MPQKDGSGVSSIGAVSSVAQPSVSNAAALQKKATAAVLSTVKDSDGDFDGTKPGQVDAKDLGKGLTIDRMA